MRNLLLILIAALAATGVFAQSTGGPNPTPAKNQSNTCYHLPPKDIASLLLLPSGENSPRGFDNTQNAPRDYTWRYDRPATLTWCAPLDSGMMRKKQEYHDAVYELAAPFTADAKELFRTSCASRASPGVTTTSPWSRNAFAAGRSNISCFSPLQRAL